MIKKTVKVYLLVVLAGMVSAGCDRISQPAGEGEIPDTVERMVIGAELPGSETTRTALNDPGDEYNYYEVVWKTGDKISVNGVLSDEVASGDNGKKAVDFTIEGSLSAPYKVLYPGTTSVREISLPATQHYVPGSFDGAAAASYGTATKVGDKFNAKLKNFCGIVRIALKGSATLDRIELNSLGDECLYGDFDMTVGPGGFTGSFNGGTEGTLTYSFDGGLKLTGENTYCYIAIPAQTYAHGIEALVYQKDGAYMRLKFWGEGKELEDKDLVAFQSKIFVAGRTENLFEINSLTAEDGGIPIPAAPGITVATYNIMRFNCAERNSEANSEHLKISGHPAVQLATVTALQNTHADVIGIQEIDSWSTNDGLYDLSEMALKAGFMSDYAWNLSYPNHISESGFMSGWVDWFSDYDPDFNTDYSYACGFAYRTSVLNLLDSGRVWLRCKDGGSSSVPDYHWNTHNAYGYCGHPTRTLVYARFAHKASGMQFYFLVTHLPTTDQVQDTDNFSCVDACVLDITRFVSENCKGLPCILVGDMNRSETEDDGCYAALTSSQYAIWDDAYKTVKDAGNLNYFYQSHPGTFSGSGRNYHYTVYRFCKNHPERRVDQIFTLKGSGLTAKTYRTIRSAYFAEGDPEALDDGNEANNIWYPSNHLPVVSYIAFE